MTVDQTLHRLLCSLAVLALVPTVAGAQTVRGVVTEDGTLKPLPGAFVVLVDEDGDRRGGVLADEDGRFFLRADGPGRYRLVAEIIGYAGTETNLLELQAGESVEYNLEVPVQAVSLEGIAVQTEARCSPHPGSGPQTAQLWEEARKALEVTHWGEEQEALNMRIMQYSRELSANAHSVREASQQAKTGYYKESPYVSRPVAELAEGGYIQQAGDNEYDYYGPDAEVLLSDVFLESHCFRVVESDEDASLVGLRFEPIDTRDIADIEGVLWLERSTAGLRSLDFRYTRLPFRGVTSNEAGGRVEFERLASGAWIVNRWRLRMPMVAEKQGPSWRSGSRTSLEVVGLNEIGAEVQSVTDVDGTVIAEAAGATLYGVVWDSITAEPLADATVLLDGTDHRASTAIDGTYRFTGLPSGVYHVRFAHPNLDVLGVELDPRTVALESGGGHRLPLAIPDGRRIAEVVCTDESDRTSYLYGRVMDASRTWPIQDAVVRLDGAGEPRTVTADADGIYRFCVRPGPQPVRVTGFRPGDRAVLTGGGAQQAAETGQEVELTVPTTRRQDLTVDVPATRVFSTWANRINGQVLERAGKDPIAGASVTLSDSAGRRVTTAVTNEDGRFQLPHPGTGHQFVVEADHIGYAKSTGRVDFDSRDELNVELLMDTRAIELEPIVVVERRRDYLAEMGYYIRKDRGLGKFIERVDIERYNPSVLTDVVRRTPGVRITDYGVAADIEMMGARRVGGFEGSSFMNTTGTGGMKCRPAVFLDGALARQGGDPRVSERAAPDGLGTTRSPATTPLNDIVAPEQIEAIEVYRRASEVPARYTGNGACGVIAIWTRR